MSPAIVRIDATPGYSHTLTYRAIDPAAGQDSVVSIGLKETTNPLAKYVIFPEQTSLNVPRGGSASFDVTITLPDPLPDDLIPGPNDLWIGVSDGASVNGGGFAVISNTYALLRINVPYPGRYVLLSLNAQDAASGQSATIDLTIHSQGKQTIQRATATIDIFADNNRVLTLPAKSASNILTSETRTLSWTIDNVALPVGSYRAVAHVDYDGEQKDVEATFRVGSPDLQLTNYTRTLEAGAIRKFDVHVQSVWNNDLADVYADVTIGSPAIATVRTPNIERVGPWKEETLTGFLDTTGIVPATYPTVMVIHYGGETKTETGQLTIVQEGASEQAGQISSGLTLILAGLGVLMLLLIAINLYMFSRRKH